jgi:hypothetical protein
LPRMSCSHLFLFFVFFFLSSPTKPSPTSVGGRALAGVLCDVGHDCGEQPAASNPSGPSIAYPQRRKPEDRWRQTTAAPRLGAEGSVTPSGIRKKKK